VSTILSAFGSIPLYVLGMTYLDDASPHGTAAVHMGILSYIHYLCACCEQVLVLAASESLFDCPHKISKTAGRKLM